MRLWIRSALFTIIMSSSLAHAYFPVNPFMTILPATVTAQVYNPYYEPILCQGTAFGRTLRGFVFQGFMREIVPPGQYRYVSVYVNNPYLDRFATGWANVGCMFLR